MKEKTSGFGPSLIELVVAVMLFSLASAACVKIFVYSKLMSDDGASLSGAITAAQTAAECFKSVGGDAARTADMLGGASDAFGFSAGFDEDWNSAENDPKYVLRGDVTDEDGLSVCMITVKNGDEEIYEITVASHGEAAS